MQLMEFKYRFKMANTRLKSLEHEVIDMQKDFSQREIAMIHENGNLLLELESATARALGAESVISKLENEVMLIYGIQQKDQGGHDVIVNKKRLSWASLSSEVSKLFGATAVPADRSNHRFSDSPRQELEKAYVGNKSVEHSDAAAMLTPTSSESAVHQADIQAALYKVAALALHISIRYKTSARELQRGFWVWNTNTIAQRVLVAAKAKYEQFKKQNEKYQTQVKEHWSKTESYMKKLREKYDDSKKKRDELKQELSDLSRDKISLASDVEMYQTRISYLETEIENCRASFSNVTSSANDDSKVKQLQDDLMRQKEIAEAERASCQLARLSAANVLDVLSEFKQWDEQQQSQIENLAAILNIDLGSIATMRSPSHGEKARQVSFTPAADKTSTPQAYRIMNSLRKSAASSKKLLKAVSRTPSRGRSLHAAMKDAEPQFTSTAMRKFDSVDAENDDADFDLKVPLFSDIAVPPVEVELTQNVPVIFNPDIEAAMTGKVPLGRAVRSKPVVQVEAVSNLPAIGKSDAKGNHHHSIVDTMSQFEDSLEDVWRAISSQKVESKAVASNVRVAVRMRPLNAKECGLSASRVVKMSGGKNVTVLQDSSGGPDNNFSYDFCFDAAEDESNESAGSQKVVFEKLGMEVLAHAWHGYNACLFAYGQTGSGKSYSMMGTALDAGIIPRVCRALFYMIIKQTEQPSRSEDSDDRRGFSVEASYLEIYNENIRDLLDPSRVNLKVREHPTTGVFVENLSSCAVECYKDVEDLLEMGLEQRTTAATNMNNESSRSHSVFTLSIRSYPLKGHMAEGDKLKNVRLSRLRLVDLAGSERASSTGATGARLKEGANINKSLSTLGRCISALAKIAASGGAKQAASNGPKVVVPPKPAAPVVPFRESILTWLLRESLCGNAKTSMLATISPAHVYLGETLSTLRYAYSAKQISTQAVVNEDPTTKIINDLRGEVLRLREQLEKSLNSGSVANSKMLINNKLRMSLSNAESALQAYERTNNSENQRLSMKNVKRNLLNRRVSSFGTEDMTDTALLNLPYFVFLSNDPQLNLAVKVYLPIGKKLKIGKRVSCMDDAVDSGDEMLDLQIDGLGIEDIHCVFSHEIGAGGVCAVIAPHAVTYHNGVALLFGEDDDEYTDGFILRSSNYAMDGENYGVTSNIIRRMTRGHGHDSSDRLGSKSTESQGKCGSFTASPIIYLTAGDRLVLGECSHVFVFVTPEYAYDVNLGKISMPTYSQAIREVILGRVESTEEKKRRVVTRMCNVYRKPAYKKYFEESFIDALKSVRESSKMAHRLCPERGLFFKVTISSLIDMSSLFSLSINDLCDYTNLTIRVRCCEIVNYTAPAGSHEDSLRLHMSPSGSNSARKHILPTPESPSAITLPGGESDETGTLSNLRSASRPMSLSHRSVSNPGRSMSDKGQSNPTKNGPSVAYVHPDSCRVVMEISLHSFYEGLVVFRALYGVMQPVSNCLAASRAIINTTDDEFFSDEDRDLEIMRIIVDLVHSISTLGSDSYDTTGNSEDMDLTTCRGLFEIYRPGICAIRDAFNSVGIDGESFFEMFYRRCRDANNSSPHQRLSLSRHFVRILIDVAEDSLFRGILSCFESSENLVMHNQEMNDCSNVELLHQRDRISSEFRKILDIRRGMVEALAVKNIVIEDAKKLLSESATVTSKVWIDNGVPEEGTEVILPSEYYEQNRTVQMGDSLQFNEDNYIPDFEELLISEKDREGATDWTIHVDHDSGYKFIYSQTLNESRWLAGEML